jgi:hypothetical protein
MTLKRQVILLSTVAFLACSGEAVNAQTPTEPRPDQPSLDVTVDRDRDANWGWLGLLGLLGLIGLTGRRGVIVGTRRTDRM